jgi:hypothetical protein
MNTASEESAFLLLGGSIEKGYVIYKEVEGELPHI